MSIIIFITLGIQQLIQEMITDDICEYGLLASKVK